MMSRPGVETHPSLTLVLFWYSPSLDRAPTTLFSSPLLRTDATTFPSSYLPVLLSQHSGVLMAALHRHTYDRKFDRRFVCSSNDNRQRATLIDLNTIRYKDIRREKYFRNSKIEGVKNKRLRRGGYCKRF